jgi:hypothetical protein
MYTYTYVHELTHAAHALSHYPHDISQRQWMVGCAGHNG